MRLKSMIALAAVATALPAAALAAAEAWHRVGGNAASVTYVDASSIGSNGGEREAWAMSVFAKPIDGRVYSARIRYAVNCAEGYYRSLRYVHLGADGEELSNHESTTSSQRRTPDAGSISEKMVRFICTGSGGTRVADPRADAPKVMASAPSP